jgi:hypothetical protein
MKVIRKIDALTKTHLQRIAWNREIEAPQKSINTRKRKKKKKEKN